MCACRSWKVERLCLGPGSREQSGFLWLSASPRWWLCPEEFGENDQNCLLFSSAVKGLFMQLGTAVNSFYFWFLHRRSNPWPISVVKISELKARTWAESYTKGDLILCEAWNPPGYDIAGAQHPDGVFLRPGRSPERMLLLTSLTIHPACHWRVFRHIHLSISFFFSVAITNKIWTIHLITEKRKNKTTHLKVLKTPRKAINPTANTSFVRNNLWLYEPSVFLRGLKRGEDFTAHVGHQQGHGVMRVMKKGVCSEGLGSATCHRQGFTTPNLSTSINALWI